MRVVGPIILKSIREMEALIESLATLDPHERGLALEKTRELKTLARELSFSFTLLDTWLVVQEAKDAEQNDNQ